MKRLCRLSSATIAGALAATLLLAGCLPPQASGGWAATGAAGGSGPDADSAAPAVGQTAPNFRLPTEDGKAIELSSLRGRPVVVNFWATWCGPCKTEMPELQAFYDDYRRTGLEIVAVDMQETAEDVIKYRQSLGIAFPTVLDQDGAVSRRYLIRGVPTTFLIDRNGVIQDINVGPVTRKSLEQKVGKMS